MKILFVHTRYYTSDGGEDSALQSEITLMRRKGHEVEILMFDNATVIDGVTGKLKAAFSAIYNKDSAGKIKMVIENFRPDIVHIHNFFFTASPSVLIQAHKQKIPVVATLHNFRLLCVNTLLLRNNRICELCVSHVFPWYGVKYKCYHDSALQSAAVGAMSAIHKLMGTWKNKVDLFISPSTFSRNKYLSSSLRPDPDKIQVKYNFIDDPGVGIPANREDYYLFVGRLSQEKGIEILLDAFLQIPEKKIIVAGDGPLQEMLILKYAPYSNIIFLGRKPRAEILELMKKCKVLIFPSICYEGLPLTIAEAFATGTPVIGSSMGAMQEMIFHGYNGLLFEPGNPEKLAEAIMMFNSFPDKDYFALYGNARASYLQNYHPDKCYDDVMTIYNKAIQNRLAKS